MSATETQGTGDAPAIILRQASPADHAAALPLFQAFYREEGFENALDGLAETLRGLLDREDTAVFLALAGPEPVGAAACSSSFGLEVGLYAELEIFTSGRIGAAGAWLRN